MCPGNRRANGEQNPHYASTFVFDNDFPALRPDLPGPSTAPDEGLLIARAEHGICRVVCFSPRHDLTFARMTLGDIVHVVDCWAEQHRELASRPGISYVQIFENRGAMMGASNPHPHGQIWASSFVPDEIAQEEASQLAHAAQTGGDLLADYAALEEQLGQRVIFANTHFLCVVPYWATWPFETLVIARDAAGSIDDLAPGGREALAEMLHRITAMYDRLFETSFPYTMGFHMRPVQSRSAFRLHAHLYPPLLRSATIRKFMVGFELLAMPQRDVTPEDAAAVLRRGLGR
jgi:UDPglucose--hexose-1-phosphate uridylyltransferase